MKVIPKVGQVWNSGSYDAEILSNNLGVVTYRIGNSRSKSARCLDNFLKQFTFVPQNDLEWLAVNEQSWDGSRDYQFIFKDSDCDHGVDYCHSKNCDVNSYTIKQWQDKRNELFGEKLVTKMKVEYVNCNFQAEWEAVRHYNEVGVLFLGDKDVNDVEGHDVFSVICANYEDLCRKVETPVTWKNADYTARVVIDSKLASIKPCSHDEFIATCHLIASLTDNPNE